jgi:surface antigen
VIDAWRGIPVRANGIPYHRSHGGHHAASGYYYGRQWQCVEYVKRFYHDRFGHWMPDVMGHAKSFYDPAVPHGQVNPRRALLQFANGGDEPPRLDDLMAWDFGDFGHVAIVSKVEAKEGMVEVVQQNVRQGSRERFSLVQVDGRWEVRGRWNPVGWMRAR